MLSSEAAAVGINSCVTRMIRSAKEILGKGLGGGDCETVEGSIDAAKARKSRDCEGRRYTSNKT